MRLEHLRVVGEPTPPPPVGNRRRAKRGTGSKREVRPGVWRLTVSDGVGPDGKQRRRSLTIHGNELDAADMLARLAETTHAPTRLGDLRLRELLDRYLTWLETGRRSSAAVRFREVAESILEPAVGRHYAAMLDVPDVYGLLNDRHCAGAVLQELKDIHRLIADAYQWARDRRWTSLDPIAGLVVRDITG